MEELPQFFVFVSLIRIIGIGYLSIRFYFLVDTYREQTRQNFWLAG